ncbi:MAG: hypothetical protein DI598_12125 [Pseudopedobacter saltans]|uniref:Uncharacterized protein n=1 Tax=Pseudopedobacter saltans TaxID=151895 RepID=A0A2W5GKW4_9SPHI|nr:MAG: hypothetical protein DI598_12125 [Pseudopedobacter saltans]
MYLSSEEKRDYSLFNPYAYIEITTYGKKGPMMKDDASQAVSRPIPFSYGKTFYQPKYVDYKSTDSLPDVRATVYWNPRIVTDSAGKAKVCFYATPNASSYLINVEGTDGNGNLGWSYQYLPISDDKKGVPH